MSDNKQEQRVDALCHRAIVPVGYDPRSDAEIERMLEALGGEDSVARTERILAKVLGERALVWEEASPEPETGEPTESETAEFAEMFRAPGGPLSEDLEDKLRAMEERAREELDEDDEAENSGGERGDGGNSK